MNGPTPSPPAAPVAAWIALGVLTLPALLAAMDLSVLFMAVPEITVELAPTSTQQLWILDIYGFLMAGLLVTMGTLGDRIGRRRLLLTGAAVFGAASLVAAFAPNTELLIAGRALLGIGGATLAPSTLALIRDLFPDPRQRRTAVGVWTGAFSAGFPLGAVIGGLLVEHFWWGSVFLINIPVMALLLATAPLLIPESRDPHPGPLDLTSVGLSLAAVLPVIYGLKTLAEAGGSAAPVAAVLVGLVAGYGFIRRQRRLAAPMIDVGLFRSPAFSASVGANLALVLASAGIGMLAVQHLQLVLGYRPLIAAWWLLPTVALLIVGIIAATTLARWVRPGYLVATGLGVAATGLALLTRLAPESTIGEIVTGYGTFGLGMGLSLTLAVNLVITAAPPAQAGAAAAVSETGAELGGALGIAILGTIAAATYRGRMAASLPDGLPATAGAAETLGGAVAVAERLPEQLAGPLLATARAAFTDGLTLAAGLGAALLALTAVVTAVVLRRERAAGTGEAGDRDRPG